MYCVATLHPDLVEARRPGYRGGFFTPKEKRALIRKFYEERLEVPLCIDHCGAQTCGFVVPDSERIGRVVDLFNGEKGQLMVKLKLDNTHPAYARINRGLDIHKESWGVSVWIDFYNTGRKELTHVALTTDPLFGRHGTWLHKWGLEERVMDRYVAEHFYREGRGQCYAAPDYQERLKDSYLTARQRREKLNMSNPPAQNQQNQQQPTNDMDGQYDDEEYEEEEELEQVGGGAESMQTEEQAAVPVQPEPVQQQQQPAPTKTPNNGADNNHRPVKRRRADGGLSVPTAVGQALPVIQNSLEPVKDGDKIDFEDFMEVKRQYDLYGAHITASKVPFHQMDPAFKRAFNRLDDKMTEYKQVAMDYLDSIEKSKYLKPDMAHEFRSAISDHNTNARSQECMLGFVAASRGYLDSNIAQVKLENDSLREKVKLLEENRLAQQQRRQQQQQANAASNSVGRTPKQGRSTAAPQTAAPQSSLSSVFDDARPLPPQYKGFVVDDGTGSAGFDQSKFSAGQRALQSCFTSMFSSGSFAIDPQQSMLSK